MEIINFGNWHLQLDESTWIYIHFKSANLDDTTTKEMIWPPFRKNKMSSVRIAININGLFSYARFSNNSLTHCSIFAARICKLKKCKLPNFQSKLAAAAVENFPGRPPFLAPLRYIAFRREYPLRCEKKFWPTVAAGWNNWKLMLRHHIGYIRISHY